MPYQYKYPRPALTIDAVVFKKDADDTFVLLIQRKNPPYKNRWALPGGFVDMDETLEESAARELQEETGLSDVNLKQLRAFSALERDPRGRTISVVFWGILNSDNKISAGDDAAKVQWFNIKSLPPLAFDHREVLEIALQKL